MRLSPLIALTALIVIPRSIAAQSYEPTYANPTGHELVMVYLGATSCGPCRAPEMPRLLDSLKILLQQRATAEGRQFRAVIVALDWVPDSGLILAREDGHWDEINTGRNWFSLGAAQFIWADSTVTPAMPQVLVYEQDMTMGARVAMGPMHILQRIHAEDAIARWVRQGAPIPRGPGLPNNGEPM